LAWGIIFPGRNKFLPGFDWPPQKPGKQRGGENKSLARDVVFLWGLYIYAFPRPSYFAPFLGEKSRGGQLGGSRRKKYRVC